MNEHMFEPPEVGALDFLVGGIPRSGTTLAAKFFSLHEEVFCYAGETSILPFLYNFFAHMPCPPKSVDRVLHHFRAQLEEAMLNRPRLYVSRGAHPGNEIFNRGSVDEIVHGVATLLREGRYGQDLIRAGKRLVGQVIRECVPRKKIGEKTPENIFPIVDFGNDSRTHHVIVVRDPVGVACSMFARAMDASDRYNALFSAGVERNIGHYLKFGAACVAGLCDDRSLVIRYEELANNPAEVLIQALAMLGCQPDDHAIAFVEHGRDRKVADRAPMQYRRRELKAGCGGLNERDYWKVMTLTRGVREALGYGDETMARLGFSIPDEWPGDSIEASVLPVTGFDNLSEPDKMWMGGSGTVIAYLSPGKKRVTLRLWSDFPENLVRAKGALLRASVGGAVKEAIKVEAGPRHNEIEISLCDEDTIPMGKNGRCALITLDAPFAYAPILVDPDSRDARMLSFLWYGWSMN